MLYCRYIIILYLKCLFPNFFVIKTEFSYKENLDRRIDTLVDYLDKSSSNDFATSITKKN